MYRPDRPYRRREPCRYSELRNLRRPPSNASASRVTCSQSAMSRSYCAAMKKSRIVLKVVWTDRDLGSDEEVEAAGSEWPSHSWARFTP
jgi:hypothetical protein